MQFQVPDMHVKAEHILACRFPQGTALDRLVPRPP